MVVVVGCVLVVPFLGCSIGDSWSLLLSPLSSTGRSRRACPCHPHEWSICGIFLLINFVLSCIKIDLSSWQVVVGLEMVCGPKLIFFPYWCQNHSCMVCGVKLIFFISSSTDRLTLSGDSHLQWDWQLVVTFSFSYPKTFRPTPKVCQHHL